MLALPVLLAALHPNLASCLRPQTAKERKDSVEALLSEAKAWPLKVLEPGDELLPAAMPDRFKPQLVIMDAELDQTGRVSDCYVRQQSKFDVLNAASCDLVRKHYVALPPVGAKKQKIAVDWTSRTLDAEQRACSEQNGTVPVASSLWIDSAVFKGTKPQNGAALLALDVGTAGLATQCTVLAAAELSEALQRNLCRLIVQRAVIMPAIDEHDKLVPARLTMKVRFIKR